MSDTVKIITTANFDEIKNTAGIYLVDLWATWCAPCKAMSPIIQTLSEDADLKSVQFCKAEIDENPEVGDFFAVSSIPSFYLIQSKGDGTLDLATDTIKKFVGSQSAFDFKTGILAQLDKHNLAKATA